MKNILLILLVCMAGFVAKAQQRFPTGFPSQFNTGWNKWGYAGSDSGLIVANRDTNWLAKYSGTVVFKPSNKQFYWFDSTNLTWNLFGSTIDTTSLSNRINLKLNISDTATMLLPYLRKADTTNKWVQDVYVRNDSLFKFKNGAETFLDTLGNGGVGSGTVTSVALSMPSAFSVTGSPITGAGTFAVSGAGTSLQYIRGNGTLATTDTGMIPDFYLKARSLFTGTSPITFNQFTGSIGINNATATGTKGAAAFTGAFSDNGIGLIDLLTLGSAGSCTGCVLNIDAKGRITGYSDGAGGATNNVNLGAGFRILNSATQEMRTLFVGFGQRIDSVANADGLTWSSDTTRGSGVPTYFYTDSLFNSFDVLVNSGLSKSGDTVQLGSVNTTNNPLNHNTWINTAGFKLTVQGSTGSGNVFEAINLGSGTGVFGQSVSEYGVLGSSTSLYGVYGTSTTSNAIRGWTTNGNTAAYFEGTASSTNTVIPTVQIKRTTSGTAAAGIGSSIEYYVEKDNGANNTVSNSLISLLTTATSGGEVSQFEIYGVNAATLARKAALAGTGQWTWDGYAAGSLEVVDSTNYKPIVADASGNIHRMVGWPGGGGAGVTSVSGTANRITSTGGTTPVIDIAATYVGQTSITTLGTIATGTWNGTTIGATFGGTGQTTVTTGDLLYGSATNTWSKLADVATGNALISEGVATAPSWGKIGLTTHVSGILPIANGGTGTATPSLVEGTNITITGTWPNQTINATGGSGSQTWPQTLAVGRTFSADDSAIITNLKFKFVGGTLQTDTLDVLKTIRVGTSQSVDDRLKMIIKDNSTATTSFAAVELKTTTDDNDLNVDGATIVKHDSAYNLTPGYGNTLQVYTLAGSSGTIIGNNNFVGVTTPYTPGENEISNGFIRFELGPIWPQSEKMRLNNRGEIIFGWTTVRSYVASQTGTTVNDPVNSFFASDVGKFFCWGDRAAGGSASFVDRITGYIDANNITVETNRTISAQGGRVCIPHGIIDTLGNALYRYVSLDSIKFATGDETAFFKFKPVGDTLRLVREGTATDAAFDATTGITVARLPRDLHLMGTTYSKIHFRDATHTLSDITANSTATTVTTLDNLPINFNPNNAPAATVTSTKFQTFKPLIVSSIATTSIGKLDVYNPDGNISVYIENSRASGTNFGAIIDVTAASSENRALYATANSGTVNKAIMVPGSSGSASGDFGLSIETTAKNYLAGKLGINITTPVWGLDVQRTIGANKDSVDLQSTTGTRQMLVIDTSNGKFQRMDIPGAGGATIYTGDGTLGADRNIASGGFTLRLSGANNSDTVMSIINSGTSGIGLFSSGTLFGVDAQSANVGLRAFGTVQGMLSTGDGSYGATIKSNAIAGLLVQSVPATDNTVQEVLRIERGVNGSPGANGVGGSATFYNKRTDNASALSNSIESKFIDAVAATLTSQLNITGINSGTPGTIATFDGNGNVTLGATNALVGTATNNNAVAGNIGEYVESNIASGSAVSLTTATSANVTSISLAAGDWDVEGIVNYSMTGATTANFSSGANSTSATLGGENTFVYTPFTAAGLSDQLGEVIPVRRFSLSGTTTIYLIGNATFSVGSASAYGLLRARRVR